jgi:hypothetical protein
MKDLLEPEIDRCRDRSPSVFDHFGEVGDGECGRLFVNSTVTGERLCVIACGGSAGHGWDHLSVSCQYRIPVWVEMEQIKRMFFKDGETAYQLHVPPSDHINQNPNVLHLWRCHTQEAPRPPGWMVGRSPHSKKH